MILADDVELRASQRMKDTNDGGGAMSATVIESNSINRMFGPVSSTARLTGQVNLRQAHLYVNLANEDTYYGVGAIIDSAPADVNTNVMLFKTGDTATTRPTAQRYLESYVSIGAVSQMHPLGTQVSGALQISAYMDLTDTIPNVGEIYILSIESGTDKGETISFQIQSVTSREDSFQYRENESITSPILTFNCKVVEMTIASPLPRDFPGESPTPLRPGETVIRRSTTAAAAEYHGISTITAPLAIDSDSVSVANVLMTVVPQTTEEEVSAELSLARIDFPLVIGTYSVTVTDTVYTHAIEVTSGNVGLTWSLPLSPLPAPSTLTVSYLSLGRWYELTDNGSGVLTGSDARYGAGSISYVSGACVLAFGYDPDVGSAIVFQWASANQYTTVTNAGFSVANQSLDFDLTGANALDVIYYQNSLTKSFRFISPQTNLLMPSSAVSMASVNWTSGDANITWTSLPDMNTQITCIAMNATTSTAYTITPFWNAAWLIANPKLATFTVSPTALAAFDKFIQFPVAVYDGATLIAVGNPIRPIGYVVQIKWNQSGELYVINWLRAPTLINPTPLGTVNLVNGNVSLRIEFEATVENVVYKIVIDSSVFEAVTYSFDGSTTFPASFFKRVYFMMDGVEHYVIYYGDIPYNPTYGVPQSPPYFYSTVDAIESFQTSLNPCSAIIAWKRIPETPNIRMLSYSNGNTQVTTSQLDPSTARPRIVNVAIPDSTLLTRFHTEYPGRTVPIWYNVDVYKNGSGTAMTADDTLTPIFNRVELTWNEHGVLIPIWLRQPVTMTPSSIGSITPLVNTITLTADFAVTAGGNTYEIKIKDSDGAVYFITRTMTTQVEYSKPHGISTVMAVNVNVGDAVSTEVRRQSFPLDSIKIPIVTGIADDIMVNSFRMRWDGREYHDDTIGNSLYSCALPWVELNKEYVGTIDRENKTITLDEYSDEALTTITDVAFAVVNSDRYTSEIWARTPLANIRPGSLTFSATKQNGTIIIGEADQNGIVTETEVTGVVDQQNGYLHLTFTSPIQPGTLKYSCVMLRDLPISAEELGVDPGRFPTSGKVQVFNAGNVVVIHNTASVTLPNPAVAGAVINCGRTHVARVRLMDARGRVVKGDRISYGQKTLLSCLSAGEQSAYMFWEITDLGTKSVTSIVVSSDVATVAATAHGFYMCIGGGSPKVTIAGAAPAGLNGLKTITVTNVNTFTFATSGIADGTATGTITATCTGEVWVPSSTDLDAGLVQLANPLDLDGYDQPLVLEHTIEHAAVATSVDLNGTIEIDRRSTFAIPNGSSISSQLYLGDLFPRYSNLFSQNTWLDNWSDSLDGDACDSLYNDVLFPIEVTNRGTISERWRIEFIGATLFACYGEVTGYTGQGNISGDDFFAPANPFSDDVTDWYFRIDKRGWTTKPSIGNVLRFNTVRAGVFWVARCVQPGAVQPAADKFGITFRGDVASA